MAPGKASWVFISVFLVVLVSELVSAETFTVTVSPGDVELRDFHAASSTITFSMNAGETPASVYLLDSMALASYETFGNLQTSAPLSCVNATDCEKSFFTGESVAIVAVAFSTNGDTAATVELTVDALDGSVSLYPDFTETLFQLPSAYEIYSVYYDCTMDYTINSLDGSTAVVQAIDAQAYMDWIENGGSGIPSGSEPDSCSTESSCSKQLTVTADSDPLLVLLFVSNLNSDDPAHFTFTLSVSGCDLAIVSPSDNGGGGNGGDDSGNDGDSTEAIVYEHTETASDSAGANWSGVLYFLFYVARILIFVGCCCCVCCILPGAFVVLLIRTRRRDAPQPAQGQFAAGEFSINNDATDDFV
eukprot:CAMPEP_0114617772 /NCGR_PEP_ID=MMETSP0168-20121206/7366_1 /TAXON_ID=95228 ORGANISM="Vannella sp., Strain DIVA3 517/6/12" /NCGR_SAMPLE_ID=MMETSP0168 /ASSEMBLY_ACC=CAM_ASM_000044 /LENGTH=359 /DNA_ID=CAMNT_0001828911 /DNA_START=7 /DNA_END=1086 /DNA_ORIENTATION=+